MIDVLQFGHDGCLAVKCAEKANLPHGILLFDAEGGIIARCAVASNERLVREEYEHNRGTEFYHCESSGSMGG
jgi:hypothetical protein